MKLIYMVLLARDRADIPISSFALLVVIVVIFFYHRRLHCCYARLSEQIRLNRCLLPYPFAYGIYQTQVFGRC